MIENAKINCCQIMIKVKDKYFDEYISEEKIRQRVVAMAKEIVTDCHGKELLFLSILNGSFVFTADLFRLIDLPAEISFLKLSSYSGTASTGQLRRLIGLNEDMKGKTVIILEDIVDTGRTLDGIISDLTDNGASEIKVATLLFKPDAYKGLHRVDYRGFDIPNDFVIGYGLDYDGYGRNLRSIYVINENQN